MRVLQFYVTLLFWNYACTSNTLEIDSSISNKPVFKYSVISESYIWDKYGKLSKEKCENILSIHLIRDEKSVDVQVLGDYVYKDQMLSFKPRFQLGDNLRFEIRYGIDKREKKYYTVTTKKNRSENAPFVKHIFPLVKKVPSNILTFYIEFDQSMQPDQLAFQYVKLFNENGKALSRVWREKSYWINDNKILVMMIHPGRVKHGIRATSNLDDIFIPENTYTLQVEEGLKSLSNGVTNIIFQNKIVIKQDDKTLPVYHNHDLVLPKSNSKDLLVLSFSEPMDYGLMWKWFKIIKGEEVINGTLTTKDGIKWSFKPDYKWEVKDYEIVLKNKIADLAHNQLDRLFEVNNEDDFTKHHDITYSFTIAE